MTDDGASMVRESNSSTLYIDQNIDVDIDIPILFKCSHNFLVCSKRAHGFTIQGRIHNALPR
ncbi:hypothetical protein ACTXT7_003617 [Hymenolepis weldensis]